ncbi:MAG: tyrosine-type recombinase/integrase [Candidatus Thorarchaeota archaeon]|jgi:integrase
MGSRDDALTQDEYQTLLSAAETVQDRLMLLLLGDVGLRAGELANLKPRNFRWQLGQLECGQKTAAGKRTLPLKRVFPVIWDLCRQWYKVHDSIGRNRHNLRKAVKRLAEKAELTTNVYPHALRATAATYFPFNPRFKIKTSTNMCKWFGWESISTGEFYINKSGIELEEAFE